MDQLNTLPYATEGTHYQGAIVRQAMPIGLKQKLWAKLASAPEKRYGYSMKAGKCLSNPDFQMLTSDIPELLTFINLVAGLTSQKDDIGFKFFILNNIAQTRPASKAFHYESDETSYYQTRHVALGLTADSHQPQTEFVLPGNLSETQINNLVGDSTSVDTHPLQHAISHTQTNELFFMRGQSLDRCDPYKHGILHRGHVTEKHRATLGWVILAPRL